MTDDYMGADRLVQLLIAGALRCDKLHELHEIVIAAIRDDDAITEDEHAEFSVIVHMITDAIL